MVFSVERKRERKMAYPIIVRAKRVARSCFLGIAIPHQPSLADGVYGPIRSEKVLKFNRKALMRGKLPQEEEKSDPRFLGGTDHMRFPVGKPGSPERVAALAAQYAILSEEETSPFMGDD